MRTSKKARPLFFREHGFTSASRLAAAAHHPLADSETLLCRGLSTLVARGYPAQQLCELFTVTPEQLARAAKAHPFGDDFRPLGEWRWHGVGLSDEPEPERAAPAAAAG